MTTIRVRIAVEVDGGLAADHRPTALSWDHTRRCGDNPRFYGAEVQEAIRSATDAVLRGSTVYLADTRREAS